MTKKLILISLASLIFSGCASVPMSNKVDSDQAKKFDPPTDGNAGIYLYRDNSFVGGILKKDVWIDNKCIGETAPGIFFYEEVDGDKEHKLSTESEFSPNDLMIYTKSGKNYYIQQYIKIGVFVGGANLEKVDEDEGMEEVSELEMATKGRCSN